MDTPAQNEIAIQVEKDVAADLEKIDVDDESIKLIPKVPESLREGANGAYDPEVISIGPYHWGKPQFEAMEKRKRRYLANFLKRNQERGLRDHIKKIESLESELRSCYDKDIINKISGKDFVKIMLVDGCFVVELCLQMLETKLTGDDRGQERRLLYLILSDTLNLLENQLPFFLLQRIYDIVAPTTTIENLGSPRLFAQVAVQLYVSLGFLGLKGDVGPDHLFSTTMQKFPKIFHLIHLRHSLHVSYYTQRPMFEFPSINLPVRQFFTKDTLKRAIDFLSIPSATELHNSGIKFKIYKSVGLKHAKFDGEALEISPIFLNNDNADKVLNTIAFERLHIHVEPRFSSFYRFMDLLVNTSKDVELLRRFGLISHDFGSDEEVAKFFSQLTRGISQSRGTLRDEWGLYYNVNEYCGIKWHKWRASLRQDYCSSPWSTLGLIVGFILLVLTFVQSYMSLHSYFRPPNS